MPKLKTHKTAADRLHATGSKKKSKKKFMRRHTGQAHFNSRERGNDRTHKRRDQVVHDADQKNIEKLLPYS